MPTFDTTLTFFATAVLLALVPGPDNVFVLLHSAVHGRRAGLLVVLGLCTGLLGHTAAVALGLAAVFAASASAFTVLKLLGAAYLVWLAWLSWRAPVGALGGNASGGDDADSAAQRPLSAAQTYGRGVLMNITNPKVAIFFLAFLPQFVNPVQGTVVGQILALGGIFIVATLLTFGAIAYFAAGVGQVFQRSLRAQRGLNRIASLVFVGLAVKLATAQR